MVPVVKENVTSTATVESDPVNKKKVNKKKVNKKKVNKKKVNKKKVNKKWKSTASLASTVTVESDPSDPAKVLTVARLVKCVLVGDGGVGKTCLFHVYAKGEFPSGYVPTVMDTYAVTIHVKNKDDVKLEVWDTAGQEDYKSIRELSYPGTDVFVICYSVQQQSSFKNITDTWLPEIKEMGTPFVLCGTKLDLYEPGNELHVHPDEAEKLAQEHKAWENVRCSAKERNNMDKVFNSVLKCGMGEKSKFLKSDGKACIFM